MEHKIITPGDSKYPKKLIERLGDKCPDKLYYNGPLKLLARYNIAVVCSDKSGGVALSRTSQTMFTVREYEMNYIGGWYSVIETDIFMFVSLKKNNTTTLFSSKGLEAETFDSFLLDRFYPPFHKFPGRDEYFRRAKDGELLMLSISEPTERKKVRKNIMERNWISCVLADIVFIPYGPKGSKTYTTAKKVLQANIPVFTIDNDECKDLHKLGIPGFNRKTVKGFLEEKGAKLATQQDSQVQREVIPDQIIPYPKQPTQMQIDFVREGKQEK